ncbi:MAG TPA: winged helix-turn-helix domain-containing protein [Vicinamibacterales bacterium]|jgi:TolB-like protein/Flp pilus assembly protein TadD|nr:winged helix-turn-helix domain-containing protein [Vicinamibacterales bacterium]
MEQGVSFGRHRFDLETGRLWSGKREIKLTPKASAVLKALVTHAGEPVRKEELFASVWNGTIVSDDALTSCVQELRKALADDAKQPRFIETRHRRGYRFIARLSKPAATITTESDGASELWTQPAIAVFPFEDLGQIADRAHFADGITQDIITALSCWRRFPVIARNSTWLSKAEHGDPAAAARELGARYFLQGSVRRAGTKIRICVQLVDASSGMQIWARRYDRDLGNMFAVQDEITACVVQSIEPQLSRQELHRALRKHPQNLDSWDYTQRAFSCLYGALSHVHAFAGADAAEARDLLHKAINLDPASSYAHSLLALSHFHDALADWTKDPPRALTATLHAARRAVELDDDDWLSHALLGIAVLWTSRNYDRALEEVERAIALNPSAVIAYQFLGCVALFAGRPTQAVPALETVLHLDPQYQSRSLILADLSLSRLLLGDVDGAVAAATEAVHREPANVRAHHRLVAALGHTSREAEARAALETLLHLQPDFSDAYVRATYPFQFAEHLALFHEGLRRAGWKGTIELETAQ